MKTDPTLTTLNSGASGAQEMAPARTTAEAQLERVLQLALEARIALASPQWKIDPGEAIDRHVDACDAVWGELNRLLDGRADKVERLKPPPDEKKILRKAVAARLRAELPAIVANLVDEVCSEAA